MEYLSRFLNHCKVFSFPYACTEVRCLIDRKMQLKRNKPVSLKPELAKERYVLPFLTNFYSDIIRKYQHIESDTTFEANAPIWICWLQGEENAPELVRKLINITRKQANGHPVHIIDESNYSDFISIPSFIVQKYKRGIIMPQHFTDVIRTMLLVEHGGLWIDATGFTNHPIPEDVYKLPIFNVKDICPAFLHKNVAVDSTRWANYIIGGQKGAVTYRFIQDCLLKYWEHYDTCIDYFFMFYIAKIGRENIAACKQEYDTIPPNNYLCEMLGDLMECGVPYTEEEYQRFLDADTWFYKLSWRADYPLKTADGRSTLGAVVIENILKD